LVPTFLVYQKIFYIKILFVFSDKTNSKISFDANLLLGEKIVRTAEGGAEFRTQNSLAKKGETAWALLRNAHSLSSSKSFSSFKVHLFYQIRTYFQNKVS
jgi:hypothetical protein